MQEDCAQSESKKYCYVTGPCQQDDIFWAELPTCWPWEDGRGRKSSLAFAPVVSQPCISSPGQLVPFLQGGSLCAHIPFTLSKAWHRLYPCCYTCWRGRRLHIPVVTCSLEGRAATLHLPLTFPQEELGLFSPAFSPKSNALKPSFLSVNIHFRRGQSIWRMFPSPPFASFLPRSIQGLFTIQIPLCSLTDSNCQLPGEGRADGPALMSDICPGRSFKVSGRGNKRHMVSSSFTARFSV